MFSTKTHASNRTCDICGQLIARSYSICEWCGAVYLAGRSGTYACQGIVCHRCAHQNSSERMKCAACEYPFSIICPKCNSEIRLEEAACPSCGLLFSNISSWVRDESALKERKGIVRFRIHTSLGLVMMLAFMGVVFILFRHVIDDHGAIGILALLLFCGVYFVLALLALKALVDSFKKGKSGKNPEGEEGV